MRSIALTSEHRERGGETGVNEDELDNLYRAPLKEFTALRNALAGSLKQSGDGEASKRVKALRKPSASVWAVNQLYWSERAAFEALIAAGDRARAAIESGTGDDAERERQAALETALERARALLLETRQNPSEAVMRRVATTLDALASLGSTNPDPMVGRLIDDLEPTGFGVLAAIAPSLPEPEAPSREDILAARESAVAKARAAAHEADNRVERIESELRRMQDELVAAQSASEDAALKLADAETRLEQARANDS